MTVIDATGKLFEWFSEHDSFELEKDFMKIMEVVESPERDKSAFLAALTTFEQSDFVKMVEYKEVKRWVLVKNYEAFEQAVTVGGETSRGIATVLNTFCDVLGDQTDHCDATNIVEKDIRNLVGLTNYMSSQHAEQNISVDNNEKGE
jgi:hypothetical protein